MNIGNLKAVVAAYFEQVPADFVKGGQDLLLVALNSARKKAELMHDFEYSKVSVDLVVDDVNGADISTAVLSGTETAVKIKSVIAAGVMMDETLVPTRFSTTTSVSNNYLRNLWPRDSWESRYPDDAFFRGTARGLDAKVLQFGSKIFKYPFGTTGEQTTLSLQVYRWFADYTIDGDVDMFTDHGHDYLKWGAIVETNHLWKRFVPRQEGNLTAPTGMADQALAALIAWDEYIVEGGRS